MPRCAAFASQGDFALLLPSRRAALRADLQSIEESIQNQQGRSLAYAGMPVEVVFKTGERSLLTYLLHPLTKRIAAFMKEE